MHSGGGYWAEEMAGDGDQEEDDSAVADPLAGVHLRLCTRAPPSSGFAAVPEPARKHPVSRPRAAAPVCVPRPGERRRGSFPRYGGDGYSGSQVSSRRPLFSSRVRVCLFVWPFSIRDRFAFVSFNSSLNHSFPLLDLCASKATDTIVRL